MQVSLLPLKVQVPLMAVQVPVPLMPVQVPVLSVQQACLLALPGLLVPRVPLELELLELELLELELL